MSLRIAVPCIVLLCTLNIGCRVAAMPHVSECNFCMNCHVGDPPGDDSGDRALLNQQTEAASQLLDSVDATAKVALSVDDDAHDLMEADISGIPESSRFDRLSGSQSLGVSGRTTATSASLQVDRTAANAAAEAAEGEALGSTAVDDSSHTTRTLAGDEAEQRAGAAAVKTVHRTRTRRRKVRAPRPPRFPPPPPTPPRPPIPPRPPSAPVVDDPGAPVELRATSYLVHHKDSTPKWRLPNCTECYGCNTKLALMASQTRFLDRTFINEKGATSSWLFRAQTNRTASGNAVVKVYCVPLAKTATGRIAACTPSTILRTVKLLLALQRVADECGLDELLPRMWADKVDAVIPEVGYHVRWYGLWMEYAPGVSLENFLHKGLPKRFTPDEVTHMMHNKLNTTRVVLGAIFDLLTSQCDRHAQNIFIGEDGNIHLIDNEAALQNSWKNCAFDSILVPTSQKQEILRLSNAVIQKLLPLEAGPKNFADPQLLLDYRCYIGKKAMGTDYPPKVAQCLKSISSMTVAQVEAHFKLPSTLTAFNLHTRATDMLTRGYEATVFSGTPQNAVPKRYRMQPKCCRVFWKGGNYRCAHAWHPSYTLPIGNPVTGREWDKPRPDTGSYIGGTITDYEEQ